MKKAEEEINKICDYLDELETCAKEYHATLNKLNNIYQKHIDKMKFLIVDMSMTDWKYFSDSAKLLVENTYYLVGLLYNMCKIKHQNISCANDIKLHSKEKWFYCTLWGRK